MKIFISFIVISLIALLIIVATNCITGNPYLENKIKIQSEKIGNVFNPTFYTDVKEYKSFTGGYKNYFIRTESIPSGYRITVDSNNIIIRINFRMQY
jgi:hypothetical protein